MPMFLGAECLSSLMPMFCFSESSPVFCLTDAFRSFFNEETLEYTCDVCGHKEAKLQHKLLQLPRVLIIHLKRYKVHHELGSVCKDFRNVQIPKYIDVQNVVSANSSLPTVPEEIKEPELLVFDFFRFPVQGMACNL